MTVGTGIDRRTGQVLSGFAHVEQSLEVIFSTRIGDRVMRRLFGSEVPALLGRNLVPSTLLRFQAAVIVAIELWEPRFAIRKVLWQGAPEPARLGRIGLHLVGEYRPRGHLGDRTSDGIMRTITLQ